MKLVALLTGLLTGTAAFAQYQPLGAISFWTEGYVVTLENDTIRGQVRVGTLVNDSPMGIVVRTDDNKKINVKGNQVKLLAQKIPEYAYATGSIPRSRKMVVFERVANPRRNNKEMLIERLTVPGGRMVLYFDASGWKSSKGFSFGDFTIETLPKDLSYIVLKSDGSTTVVKRGNFDEAHETLFGDCAEFVRRYPAATRRDWSRFGDMVDAYNQSCFVAIN
ncbi:hypothetical protein GCM10023187_15280 [Nibrella viscosa]|uniref:Uncharacterized protein n=1 Tax=Nibrella viscosa TaxID=1084524 RepID=A0ABP8K7I7_9BACT